MDTDAEAVAGELIEMRVDQGVGRITLNDPATRNALSRQLSDDLARAVDAALAQGARALVLDARPPVFCSGGSIDGLLNRDVPLAAMYAGMESLMQAPVPTIAAVAGAAIGAGVNLPLVCDVTIVTPSARFDPRFLDASIHPGGGHLRLLADRVGAQGAAAMVLCGDALSGQEAVERGLAWRCVPEAELESTVFRLALRAAARPAALLQRAKQSLAEGLRAETPADAARLELAAQEWSVEQPEFFESVRRIRQRLAVGHAQQDRSSP